MLFLFIKIGPLLRELALNEQNGSTVNECPLQFGGAEFPLLLAPPTAGARESVTRGQKSGSRKSVLHLPFFCLIFFSKWPKLHIMYIKLNAWIFSFQFSYVHIYLKTFIWWKSWLNFAFWWKPAVLKESPQQPAHSKHFEPSTLPLLHTFWNREIIIKQQMFCGPHFHYVRLYKDGTDQKTSRLKYSLWH